MYDVSDLKVVDILRKDFKKWKTAGMNLLQPLILILRMHLNIVNLLETIVFQLHPLVPVIH